MSQPAIRNIDAHLCPNHGAEKIGAVAQLDITVNNEAALHVGLGFTCAGEPTRIATGSTTVRYHGEFATRAFDDSDHGGKLVIGSGNVMIGGPKGMGTVGAGTSTCEQMAAGRASGATHQSYGNCVLESVRQIIRRASGNTVTEDRLKAHADDKKYTLDKTGGSDGRGGQSLLRDYGIPNEDMPASGPATLTTVQQAIAERRGVVAFVDPHEISPDLYPKPGCHALVVTAVEVDDSGNVTAVFINDTGAGECGKKVPAAAFAAAMRNLPTHKSEGGTSLLVTKGAIW